MRLPLTFGLAAACLCAFASPASPEKDGWADLRFLVGSWVAEDVGQAGAAGEFSFAPDLQSRVLVRRNQARFPSQEGRPATVHDDLMVICQEGDQGSRKAVYFDSEGHVIQYALATSVESGTWTFTSDPGNGPRFRLVYKKLDENRVSVKFEIAPPEKPGEFRLYLEGSARRVKAFAGSAP